MTEGSNESSPPRVSVIIPLWDGHRDGCVPRLLESVERQTFKDFEIHLIKGVSPQGKAINQGAAQARGEVLIILDDDSRLADDTVFDTLVRVLEDDPSFDVTGVSIGVLHETNMFQKRANRQFSRLNTLVMNQVVNRDLACRA